MPDGIERKMELVCKLCQRTFKYLRRSKKYCTDCECLLDSNVKDDTFKKRLELIKRSPVI